MKKILAVVLAATMLVGTVFAFSACGQSKVKVYTDIELTAESYAFCIQKGNTAMKTAADELLAEIEADGTLDEIINSFFDDSATFTYSNTVSSVPTDHDQYLIVATNAEFPPFEYYQGDKLTGIDIQIASLLAEKMNKTLYVQHMEFDAVIESVKGGNYDIGMAGITVNDERKKTVDFSNEYYESAQVIITREEDTTFADCETAEEIETILKSKGKDYIIGTQRGTTGYMYSNGDEGFGYDGFPNLTTNAYRAGALAVQDLANGKINAVIIDKQPAIMIANLING